MFWKTVKSNYWVYSHINLYNSLFQCCNRYRHETAAYMYNSPDHVALRKNLTVNMAAIPLPATTQT